MLLKVYHFTPKTTALVQKLQILHTPPSASPQIPYQGNLTSVLINQHPANPLKESAPRFILRAASPQSPMGLLNLILDGFSPVVFSGYNKESMRTSPHSPMDYHAQIIQNIPRLIFRFRFPNRGSKGFEQR